jgi:ClpP class serine protease
MLPLSLRTAPFAMDAGVLQGLEAQLSAGPRASVGAPASAGKEQIDVRGGVAVLPIIGPLLHHAGRQDLASYEELARDLRVAVDSPNVRAILLEVDSPGGMVAGCGELADMIRAAAARKPVVAYVSDQCQAAGYWLASAASEVVAASTAVLGGLGVVAVFHDRRAADVARGVRTVEILSSQSPKKRPDPATDAGRAQLQATLDSLADVMLMAIAGFRGVSSKTVQEEFGRGGVLVGARAVSAGLADRLDTLDGALRKLALSPSR